MTSVVTAWFRDVGDGLDFNHISDGWDPENDDTPEPKCPAQVKAWRGGIWLGRRAMLTDDVPPRLVLLNGVNYER
jgi:hypothetical protein